jgi:DNA-binding response OmpR family regulator
MAEETRVLLIEDELRTAQFLSGGLELDGHEVVVAEDSDVAVFLAATEPFDIFVLDLAAPAASGLDVLQRILGSARDGAPVIVLSADDDPETRRVCRAAGASAFIAKPLVVDDVRASVREQLGQRRR